MIKNILFIIFVFAVLTLNIKCDQTFSVPTDITELNCVDEKLIFETDQITFNNTALNITGVCEISTNFTQLQINIANILTNSSVVNKLNLTNIIFYLNNNNIINDFLIEMNDNSSVVVNGSVIINYNALLIQPNTEIFSGGSIIINNGASRLELTASQSTTYTMNTDFINYKILEVNKIRLGFDITKYQGKELSTNYFNEGIFSTVYNGNLTFVYSNVQIGKYVNLNGGTLTLNNVAFYTKNEVQYSYYYNTTLQIGSGTNITLYRATEYNNLITGLKLEDGSKLILLNGTDSLKIRIFSLIVNYPKANSETLIHSTDANIDCDGYVSNNLTTFQEITRPTRPIKLTGYVMCSKRSMSVVIYPTSNGLVSNDVVGCPEGPGYFLCIGMMECISINSSCSDSVKCFNNGLPPTVQAIQARDIEDIEDIEDIQGDGEGSPACWNGECAISGYESCLTPYPACPLDAPIRCAGKCVADNETCGDESACVTKCPDGCYNHTRTCQPFYGCQLHYYQCADNECVQNKRLCSNDTVNLPFSNRYLPLKSSIYANIPDVATMITTNRDNNVFYPSSDLTFVSPNNTVQASNNISISPIADSYGFNIGKTNVYKNFNYYKDLLSAPFKISFNGQNSTNFADPVKFHFTLPQNFSIEANTTICLAFENAMGEWECTNNNVEFSETGVYATTTHFTNFALIINYRKSNDDDTSNSSTSPSAEASNSSSRFSKKTLAIAVSLSVVGAVLIAVGVGIFVSFKLKYTSLRRWKVSRDLERESNKSRMSSSSSSL